jgi:hypothetical protein
MTSAKMALELQRGLYIAEGESAMQKFKVSVSGNQLHIWTEDGKHRFLVEVKQN